MKSKLKTENTSIAITDAQHFVAAEAEEIRRLLRRAAKDIVTIGQKLIEVKARLEHGQWGAWLRQEFDWDERTARNFMSVAECFKSENFSDLAIQPSALYLLARPSTPIITRQTILDRARAGEGITHSDVKAAIEFEGIDAGELRRRDAAAIAAVKGEDGSQYQTDAEAKRNVLEMLAPITSQVTNTLTRDQLKEFKRELGAFVRESGERARAEQEAKRLESERLQSTLLDCKTQFINAAIALTDHPSFDESTLRWLSEFCEMLTNTLEGSAK